MVAIEDASAIRLQNGSAPPARITEALANYFGSSVTDYTTDIREKLEPVLVANDINFRIFSTTVAQRESRWTSEKEFQLPIAGCRLDLNHAERAIFHYRQPARPNWRSIFSWRVWSSNFMDVS